MIGRPLIFDISTTNSFPLVEWLSLHEARHEKTAAHQF